MWLDIKNAPKDGTEVDSWLGAPFNQRRPSMVWYEPWGLWVEKTEVEFITEDSEGFGTGSEVPTHFMLPPEGPTSKPVEQDQLKSALSTCFAVLLEHQSGAPTFQMTDDAVEQAKKALGLSEGPQS